MNDTTASMDVNSPEAALWSENMRLKSQNEFLLNLLRNIVANAEFAPDAGEAWQGTVDVYKVPLDDIEAAETAIRKETER